MNAQLKGISMQLGAMSTQKTMMEALSNSAKIMGKVNEDMNVQEISTMVKTFQKEQMKAEMNQEMVAEAMDMGDAAEEADDVYNQILGEIGMNMESGANVGVGAIKSNAVPAMKEESKEEDDLEKRLAALGD
mmetsp:Transcript_13651/g.21374  ORF Transcript_13651/g.21374 Transcript_13651/m.21374 type:complete len:132 (-) Transcript_13651:77-472(-)